jgi:hypothetical protein
MVYRSVCVVYHSVFILHANRSYHGPKNPATSTTSTTYPHLEHTTTTNTNTCTSLCLTTTTNSNNITKQTHNNRRRHSTTTSMSNPRTINGSHTKNDTRTSSTKVSKKQKSQHPQNQSTCPHPLAYVIKTKYASTTN